MRKGRKEILKLRVYTGPFILLFFLSLIAAGCGIKSYPYLAPPGDSAISEPLENDQLFRFINYTENNTNYFLGYEIYYKFYSSEPGTSLYESETAQLELTDTYDKLISFGYRRLYNREDVYEKPLIPIDPELADQAIPIAIDYRFLTETLYPVISYAENTIEAARYITGTGDLQETIYNFDSTHISSEYSDIPSTIFKSDTDTLYLSLYVLSYGKYEVFNELYSAAAHLGKITLQTENAIF